jgi:hypothetical protein
MVLWLDSHGLLEFRFIRLNDQKSLERYSSQKKLFCDRATFDRLSIQGFNNLQIVPDPLPKSICLFLYGTSPTDFDRKTNKKFFDAVKEYLTTNDRKRGSSDLHKRIRSVMTKLLNNQLFLEKYGVLWRESLESRYEQQTRTMDEVLLESIRDFFPEDF